jgi:NADH dehydrogenase/NADH:ubiquinone oxidoreductase subunit G
LKVKNVEFAVDEGPARRMKRGSEWVYGTEAAPNSRGAEAAGVRRSRSGDGSTLDLLISKKISPPAVLYVADASFTDRVSDPAFVALLRAASVLIVHARVKNALAEAADIVLPAANLSGKEGTFVNRDGRVQRFDMAIVPPPVVRTDLEILLHLGKLWGAFDTAWTTSDVFGRMKGSVSGYADLDWNSDELVGNPPSASITSAYDVLGLERRPEDEVFARPSVAAPDVKP